VTPSWAPNRYRCRAARAQRNLMGGAPPTTPLTTSWANCRHRRSECDDGRDDGSITRDLDAVTRAAFPDGVQQQLMPAVPARWRQWARRLELPEAGPRRDPRFRAARVAHRTEARNAHRRRLVVRATARARSSHPARASATRASTHSGPFATMQLRSHRFCCCRRLGCGCSFLDRLLQAANLSPRSSVPWRSSCGPVIRVRTTHPVPESREHVGTLGNLRAEAVSSRSCHQVAGFRDSRSRRPPCVECDTGGRLVARKMQRAAVVVPLVDGGRGHAVDCEQQEQKCKRFADHGVITGLASHRTRIRARGECPHARHSSRGRGRGPVAAAGSSQTRDLRRVPAPSPTGAAAGQA
jgi:hypothetical protein